MAVVQLQEKADATELAKADAPKAEPEAAQKPLPKVSPSVTAICLCKGITQEATCFHIQGADLWHKTPAWCATRTASNSNDPGAGLLHDPICIVKRL